jgi:hypothetical protein
MTNPPKEVIMAMESYLNRLKADTAKSNRQREEEARAKRPPADPRIVCEVPLKQQVQEYLLSLPPVMRDKPISLMALRAQLRAKYVNGNPSAGNLGIALSALGYTRVRDFSNSGNGRRFWLPPA